MCVCVCSCAMYNLSHSINSYSSLFILFFFLFILLKKIKILCVLFCLVWLPSLNLRERKKAEHKTIFFRWKLFTLAAFKYSICICTSFEFNRSQKKTATPLRLFSKQAIAAIEDHRSHWRKKTIKWIMENENIFQYI